MIEKLRTPGSILELAMHRCVFMKDILHLFPIGAMLPLWCPTLMKDLQTEPLKVPYVGVVRCAWWKRTNELTYTISMSCPCE